MNGCFGRSADTIEDNIILIFSDQTIMAQSGNGAACESDVTPLGTGEGLNFDEDTLKGKDSYNC